MLHNLFKIKKLEQSIKINSLLFMFIVLISCSNTTLSEKNRIFLNMNEDILLEIKDLDESIIVSISEQKLFYLKKGTVYREYIISSSKYGIGSKENSYKTPLGKHKISEKIGNSLPYGAVLKGRKWTGSIANIITDSIDTELDIVTSRILWLEGLEAGLNRGPGIGSKERFIYIHGTAEEGLIGKPASNGCIRMYNTDVIELFDKVSLDTNVWILNK
tara:strand:+ start:2476 stop:3126 length:651 start_codon:yes stop_codon:yes gene_type:complete